MVARTTSCRIGIFGPEEEFSRSQRSFGLWAPGYAAALGEAEAEPVLLDSHVSRREWSQLLGAVQGVVWTGRSHPEFAPTSEELQLCEWCRKNQLPLLAVDQAMLALNLIFGGTNYTDLPTQLPDALQHRHPPEHGLRHTILIPEEGRLGKIFGEGELVVNSQHRQAICRVARGFRVSCQAMDGVIEAIECEDPRWFALGVQWRPAADTASGLDIQIFRALADACRHRPQRASKRRRAACVSAA